MQTVDSVFLQYLVGKTLEKSASVHLLFAFEYIILASAIISTFLKYILSMIDAWLEVGLRLTLDPLFSLGPLDSLSDIMEGCHSVVTHHQGS